MKKYHRRFEIVKRLLSIPLPRNVDSIWGKILSRNISFDRWSIRDAIDTEGKGGEKKKKRKERIKTGGKWVRQRHRSIQWLHGNYKSLTGNIDNKINATKPGLFPRISADVRQYRAVWSTQFSMRSLKPPPPLSLCRARYSWNTIYDIKSN